MLSAPRPLVPSEQGAALALWQEVFPTPPGYFERYYSADPNYVSGDTLGIWDDQALVSAIHICRRPVVWEDGALLCGGIANVATREEYRRQGLSRQLLAVAIKKMEDESYHFSLLGTGTPGHYAPLGWASVRRPQAMLTLASNVVPSTLVWETAGQVAPLAETYSRTPRPLQFLRPAGYFEDWVGWDWRRQNALIGHSGAGDYLVLGNADESDEPLPILEWRARDEAAELSLFRAAVARAHQNGHPRLWLGTLPQHMGIEALQSLGEVTRHVEGGDMIRNITLPQDEYARVAQAYQAGLAVWWPGDGF